MSRGPIVLELPSPVGLPGACRYRDGGGPSSRDCSVHDLGCVVYDTIIHFQTRPRASSCWRQTGSPFCRYVTSFAKVTHSKYRWPISFSPFFSTLPINHRDCNDTTCLLRSAFAFFNRAKYAIGAIKKKLNDKNPHVALYALEVSGNICCIP